jgi:HAE1 family hydrophobic/amphiphilic exporter-1
MNISAPFIRRPVATILLAIALVGAGLFAYRFLPVAALPQVDFPVITVSAQLPGASPDTMANSVATPLIKQFSTIPSIDTMTARSVQGSTSIVIQFDLNRDIDQAAADVQAAIARTLRQLPANMTTPPSYRKVNPADAPVLLLALQSDTMPLVKLDDLAEQVISPALSTLDGVGEVQVFGAKKYAVRAEVDPTALNALGIGIDQVTNAVGAGNSIAPVGTIAGPHQNLPIQAGTQQRNAKEFSQIIIATPNGKTVRLGDVARVIDSVANTQAASTYDGKPALVLAVFRQPDANTVEVVDRVKAMLPNFMDDLGPSGSLRVLNDRSVSITQAVKDVQFTLALTVGLVALVIFIFLRRLSATLIPTLAVPISLIATLAAMYALGFSIDNVSLLGLTLSVGLVVDDAIVMLENVVRHIEEGMPPFEAALKGSGEVGFTIVSITISLVAVFIPILLMGGVVGRIFNEFAMVVTISIIASSLVSLTLTPMLSARLPAHRGPPSQHAEVEAGGRLWRYVFAGYRATLDLCLKARPIVLLVFLGTVALSGYLFVTSPKGFLPQEDISQVSISTEARQDISFNDMMALQKQVADAVRSKPYVNHVASIVGGGYGTPTANQASMFVELKPKGQRPPMGDILDDLRKSLGRISGIASYAVPVQNLRIGGVASKSQYQFVVQGIDRDALISWSDKLADAMGRDSTFTDVTSDLQANAQQATLVVDQDKARTLGITADQLRNSLYDGFGTNQASTIFRTGDSYEMIVEFDPSIPWTAEKLNTLQIRSAITGKLVSLSAFARVQRTAGLLSVNQVGQLPAVTISFNLPQGVALGQATARIEAIKTQVGLPTSITTSFAGTAQVFQDAVANQGLLLFAAVATIYIVLGILYESFIHPLTILTGLPAAAAGALLSIRLFGFDLSVIAIIGMLMLIGIVKKNAIMMIDFALVRQRAGASPFEAIREACLIRFRPIMMTTMAALMGSLPIALGTGASSELRQPLGVAVVGGLVVSQVLTLFITPVIYLYMENVSRGAQRLASFIRRRPESEPELALGNTRPEAAE